MKKAIAAQSFETVLMAARLPQTERGVWMAGPPTKLIFEIGNVKNCDL